MAKVIPVASGKGGVGKSIIALSLALSLSLKGKTVVLADFDLGGASQHLLLGMGIKGDEQGIGHLLHGHEKKLENLVTPTAYKRLHFIAGDAMLPGTHNIAQSFKERIIKELRGLVADYVIIDLGAGSSYTVVDFFLASYSGIIVANPEITSIMASYSFIKTTVFRALYRLYPPNAEEREIILKFVKERIEGSELSFEHLMAKLKAKNSLAAEKVAAEINKLKPKLVFNMSRTAKDTEWANKLSLIVKKKLGIQLELVAALPYSERVRQSVSERVPIVSSYSSDVFVTALSPLIEKISLDKERFNYEGALPLGGDDEKLLLKPSAYI
ncbi:MAG: P-loop NTPase [Spirochaetaceae bacterium]|nr:P-loop NTPase [Spirochaetaceae bacterium]